MIKQRGIETSDYEYRSATYRIIAPNKSFYRHLNDLSNGSRFIHNKCTEMFRTVDKEFRKNLWEAINEQEKKDAIATAHKNVHDKIETGRKPDTYVYSKNFAEGWFNVYRNQSEMSHWLKKHSFAILRAEASKCAETYAAYHKSKRQGEVSAITHGKPRFKKKHKSKESIELPDKNSFHLNKKGNKLKLPKFEMWVKLKGGMKYIEFEATNGTMYKRAGSWYVKFSYKVPVSKLRKAACKPGTTVGIDRNCGNIVLSISDKPIKTPNEVKDERKKRRYARQMSRRKIGSRRYKESRLKHQKICFRMKNRRKDWCHRTSRFIADRFGLVSVEKLDIIKMIKSLAGTKDSPGIGVSAQRRITRAIMKSCWGMLVLFLRYKCEKLEEVAPEYTSITCSQCGHIDKKSRPTRANFKCVKCGFESCADFNASINICVKAVGNAGLNGRYLYELASEGKDGEDLKSPPKLKVLNKPMMRPSNICEKKTTR